MIEYYVDPLEEDCAWNYLNKLQQTGSVKDYSEKFVQLIVKVVNNVTEKDKLRRYVECSNTKIPEGNRRAHTFARLYDRGSDDDPRLGSLHLR
jgi:hypothetical protein